MMRRPRPQRRARFRLPTAALFSALLLAAGIGPAAAQTDPCAGRYLLCDDFDGSAIDTAMWKKGDVDIAHRYPVRPGNLKLGMVDDDGTPVTVVDVRMFGDLHAATGRRGGVLITRQAYGGGRYEVRMRNLPGPYGCSCFWNYYDSLNESDPPRTRVYTEIDIEMPAHVASPPAWQRWRHILGLNTWSRSDSDADATYINHRSTADPFDGAFHVYRFDWHDGPDGARRIDWYVDDVFQASTTQHVGAHPAPLWVGAWPAPWPGMDYDFNVKHLYIDWVRIAAF